MLCGMGTREENILSKSKDAIWGKEERRRVLITGGAGYVGSAVNRVLVDDGYPVAILDKEFGADAGDEKTMKRALEDVDVIIPLASMVGAQVCNANPEEARRVNVGTIEMLLKLRKKHQLIVFPTSGSTGSEYGRTKSEAETLVMKSVNAISVCLATVFGVSPRMRLNSFVNYFVYEAVTKGELIVYDKHLRRNYVHVMDVALAVKHCVEHSGTMLGKSYNCCLQGVHHSKEEIAKMIKEKVPGLKIRYESGRADMDHQSYYMDNHMFVVTRGLEDGITELIKEFS